MHMGRVHVGKSSVGRMQIGFSGKEGLQLAALD